MPSSAEQKKLEEEVKRVTRQAAKEESAKMPNEQTNDLAALVKLLTLKFSETTSGTSGSETAIPEFDGESSVEAWLNNFESNAIAYGWSEQQKFIFAMNKMTKTARMLIQTVTITNYSDLKNELSKEFKKEYSAADIHRQLQQTRKHNNESINEYILKMRQLSKLGNIDDRSVIRYIVDGIMWESQHKINMYGAKDYNELKRQYEIMEHVLKNKNQQDKKRSYNDEKKPVTRKLHCFNCGSADHRRADCKSQEAKCFKCNGMGHIARNCGAESEKKVAITKVQRSKNMTKAVIINNIPVVCLIDSGAEVSLVRKSFVSKWNLKFNRYNQMIAGIGGKIRPEGVVQVEVILDNIKTQQNLVIVPDDAIYDEAILGFDVISQFEYSSGKDGYTFINLISEDEVPLRVMCAVIESKSYEVPSKYEKKVEELVVAHKPKKEGIESPITMKIELTSEKRIHHAPSRISLADREVVKNQVEQWLKDGVIRASISEYCSRLVVVDKKDGSKRVCVDFRDLNRVVQKDRFPVPLIEEVVEEIGNAVVFSIIDLENAFFHIPIEEDSKRFTAFICREGVYEFNKAPFGFCNSPAVFLRFVNHVFRKLVNESIMQIYMDDIIIYSQSEEEGLGKLERVLKVAEEYGLNIKWKKCKFLQRRISYLGYILENGSVQPDESTVAAVKNFPLPKNVKDIQSFLGMSGFFRKFIQNYAVITKPLTSLLKKNTVFQIGEDELTAINQIKYILINKPILKIFCPTAETELHCDASKEGFGAILMQKINNSWHPVYYWSKKCGDEDKNRHSYYLEIKAAFLAIKRLKHYLWGKDFKLVTDCEAFKNTTSKADLVPAVARWILFLQDFRYIIEHRKGKAIRHVDALSRYPTVMNIIADVTFKFKKSQEEDEGINAIKQILSLQPYEDYKIIGSILYKQHKGINLIVVPKLMENEIIRTMHEKGHWAVEKTQQAIEQEYFIPHLRSKVEKIIRNCVKCILYNKKLGKKEGYLHPIEKGEKPLSDIHVDHLGPMDSTVKQYKYILTVVDAFSKFVWIYPTKSTSAAETVRKLEEWTNIFGAPQRIISDRGSAFTSDCFKEWCAREQVEQILITTGVARGNGQAERVNRTILNILAKLSAEKPDHWYKHVHRTQRAINSTPSSSTKFSPFEIMFGVRMKNVLDVTLNKFLEEELVEALSHERDEIRMIAKNQIVEAQSRYKEQFDKRRKEENFYKEGDLVAIRRTQFVNGKKLASEFLGPYQVTKCKRHGRYDVEKVGDCEGPHKTSTSGDNMKAWAIEDWDTDLSETDKESDGRM